MKTWRRIGGLLAATVATLTSLQAQAPELSLPRPGAALVTEVTGKVFAVVGDERKPVKADERLRIGASLVTEAKSFATLMLSNGATLQIGSESELEVEEFGQSPVSGNLKVAELKEEPTLSRTRLQLVRGDVSVQVKPLKVARGSSFILTMAAGAVRLGEGTFRAMVRMSDLDLGVCTFELQKGAAEFELIGGTFAPAPLGRKLAFALELDKATGTVRVSEMPKETPKPNE